MDGYLPATIGPTIYRPYGAAISLGGGAWVGSTAAMLPPAACLREPLTGRCCALLPDGSARAAGMPPCPRAKSRLQVVVVSAGGGGGVGLGSVPILMSCHGPAAGLRANALKCVSTRNV